MAKLMAYADCSIIALTNDDPRLCDCNRIIDADNIPLNSDQPDKQREITLKADWKYVAEVNYRLSLVPLISAGRKGCQPDSFVPCVFGRSVFHPPRV